MINALKINTFPGKFFLLPIFILCLSYFIFELFYNRYTILVVDEFWFAHLIYHYRFGLPYLDFPPYKTVLGYYFLLLPMLSGQGMIGTLVLTKNFLAFLNSLLLFISSSWLTRFFSKPAILVSVLLLFCSDFFLRYSTHIRVDLLGYWFGFFALLSLLSYRYKLAGLLMGLGFLTTQKVIWYLFAADLVLAINWLTYARHLRMVRQILQFNLFTLTTIAVYLVFWSLIADWHTVLKSVFYEAYLLFNLDWYVISRKLFWYEILTFNPFLFFLPLTLLSLFVQRHRDGYFKHLFCITVGIIILCCLINSKMIFPYYLQALIPIFLLINSAFFSWFFNALNEKPVLGVHHFLAIWLFIATYLAGVAALYWQFQLPDIYLIFSCLAIAFGAYLTLPFSPQSTFFLRNFLYVGILFVGFIYPLLLFIVNFKMVNSTYQKANLRVMRTLLQDGSDYLSGIQFFYNKDEPIKGMRLLTGPAQDYLGSHGKKLRPVMLASLYQDPTVTAQSAIALLEKSNVKFYVNSYRLQGIPSSIKNFLEKNYEHLWGSIYLYAPVISVGERLINIKFSGEYLIEASSRFSIEIDKKNLRSKNIIYLKRGLHHFKTTFPYRLKLLPPKTLTLNREFTQDCVEKMVH